MRTPDKRTVMSEKEEALNRVLIRKITKAKNENDTIAVTIHVHGKHTANLRAYSFYTSRNQFLWDVDESY